MILGRDLMCIRINFKSQAHFCYLLATSLAATQVSFDLMISSASSYLLIIGMAIEQPLTSNTRTGQDLIRLRRDCQRGHLQVSLNI